LTNKEAQSRYTQLSGSGIKNYVHSFSNTRNLLPHNFFQLKFYYLVNFTEHFLN